MLSLRLPAPESDRNSSSSDGTHESFRSVQEKLSYRGSTNHVANHVTLVSVDCNVNRMLRCAVLRGSRQRSRFRQRLFSYCRVLCWNSNRRMVNELIRIIMLPLVLESSALYTMILLQTQIALPTLVLVLYGVAKLVG